MFPRALNTFLSLSWSHLCIYKIHLFVQENDYNGILICLCNINPFFFGNRTFNFLSGHSLTPTPPLAPIFLGVKRLNVAFQLVYSSYLISVGPEKASLLFHVGKAYTWDLCLSPEREADSFLLIFLSLGFWQQSWHK